MYGNILTLHKLVHNMLLSKAKIPLILFKIDVTKSFDGISSEETASTFCSNINGKLSQTFNNFKSFRQEDPFPLPLCHYH